MERQGRNFSPTKCGLVILKLPQSPEVEQLPTGVDPLRNYERDQAPSFELRKVSLLPSQSNRCRLVQDSGYTTNQEQVQNVTYLG